LVPWLNELSCVVYWLAPFLPETSRKATAILRADPPAVAPPLFPRL
jgi:hypothetical protein